MLSFFGPPAAGLLAVAPGNAHEAAAAPRPTDAAPASRSRRLIVRFHRSPMSTSLSASLLSRRHRDRPKDAIISQLMAIRQGAHVLLLPRLRRRRVRDSRQMPPSPGFAGYSPDCAGESRVISA